MFSEKVSVNTQGDKWVTKIAVSNLVLLTYSDRSRSGIFLQPNLTDKNDYEVSR